MNLDKKFSVRLNSEQWDRLEDIAKSKGVKPSTFIRHFINFLTTTQEGTAIARSLSVAENEVGV